MKIKRRELISILEQRVSAAQADRKRRYEMALADWQRKEVEYFDHTSEAWFDFAETIRKVVSTGKNITMDDIPETIRSRSWATLKLHDAKKPLEPTSTEQEAQLLTLIEVLNQTSDEEVSTHSLEKMGFALGRVLK